jgi:quinol monooxygenase YgiN
MQVGIEVLSKISSENRREFIQSYKVLPQLEGSSDTRFFNMLFEDVEEMNRFLWVEHWHNKNAMEEYLQSDRFKTIMGAIETLGELIHFNRIEVKNIQQ